MTVSLGDPCGVARRPSLYLASSDDDVPALVREHALRRRHGFKVDLLDREAIARRWSIAAPKGLHSFGAEIDCYRFTHRLIAAAHARGARIYDRTEIASITRHADAVTMTTVTGTRYARGGSSRQPATKPPSI
jgi:glycine/D-amino acid oxidase-like deaminating enzyme